MIRLDRSLLCAVRTSDVDCRQQESTVSASNAPVGITNRLTRIHSQHTNKQMVTPRKSSQVKSSQVKFKFQMAAAPAAFGAPAGARDRKGAARRNWHGWIALSRGFIHIVFFLIIAAPQITNFVPFSGSLQYGNATRLQAVDGSYRGHARVLLRWAEVLVGEATRRNS